MIISGVSLGACCMGGGAGAGIGAGLKGCGGM